jgi:Domain of unknown function (DUF4333)
MTSTMTGWTTIRRLAVSALSCCGALAMALALAGCGTKLDMNVLSKSISDGLTSQLGLDHPTVNCPQETRDAKPGDTFECEAKPKEGGRLVLKVTQKDDKGNVDWVLTDIKGFLSLKTVEEVITKGLKEQAGADATVSCGGGAKNLRAAKAGDTFDCTATTADGSAHTVKVTTKDTEGNIAWAVQQPPGQQPAEQSEGGPH